MAGPISTCIACPRSCTTTPRRSPPPSEGGRDGTTRRLRAGLCPFLTPIAERAGSCRPTCERLGRRHARRPPLLQLLRRGTARFARPRRDHGALSTSPISSSRQFDAFVTRPLGLDRHPAAARTCYFGNLHHGALGSTRPRPTTPDLTEKARACADFLGLDFERRFTEIMGVPLEGSRFGLSERRQEPLPRLLLTSLQGREKGPFARGPSSPFLQKAGRDPQAAAQLGGEQADALDHCAQTVRGVARER